MRLETRRTLKTLSIASMRKTGSSYNSMKSGCKYLSRAPCLDPNLLLVLRESARPPPSCRPHPAKRGPELRRGLLVPPSGRIGKKNVSPKTRRRVERERRAEISFHKSASRDATVGGSSPHLTPSSRQHTLVEPVGCNVPM